MAADRDTGHLAHDPDAKQVKGGDAHEKESDAIAARSKGDGAAFAAMIMKLPRQAQGPAIAAAHRMYGNAFVMSALSSWSRYSGMDVMALAQMVMAQCAADSAADLNAVLEDMAEQNKDSQAIRGYTTDAKKAKAKATEDQERKAPPHRKP